MKTGQLIDMLAQGSGPAPRRVVMLRLGMALVLGIAVSSAVSTLSLGLNPDLAGMGSPLVLKLVYVAGIAAGATWLTARLARPGATWGSALTSVILVFGAMCCLACLDWTQANLNQRAALLFGQSWTTCPWRVAALAVPALALGFLAVRGLAPTRLRLAGASIGLMAGGLGAFGYALHCPELSPVFVVTWYSLGMLVPAALGAALGPRILRW